MPVYVKNLQAIVYEVPHLPGPVTLQPAGDEASISNITSEIEGLTVPQYAALSADQSTGKLKFTQTSDVIIIGGTTPLIIGPGDETYDVSSDAREALLTPTVGTPAYFDCVGQCVQTIQIHNPKGACTLEFYGSIDSANLEYTDKLWSYAMDFKASDPQMVVLTDYQLRKLKPCRFFRIELISGVAPSVSLRSVAH